MSNFSSIVDGAYATPSTFNAPLQQLSDAIDSVLSIASNTTRSTRIVSVKDAAFNARGDDSTDDNAAIQAALLSASTNGGEVWFPDGSYRVTALTLYNNLTLRFASAATLKFVASQHSTNMFSGTGLSGLRIYGLKVDGEKSSHAVVSGKGRIVSLASCRDFVIAESSFVSTIRFPVDLSACSHGVITQNHAAHCYYLVNSTNSSTHLRVNNNSMRDMENRGVFIHNCSHVIVANNDISVATASDAKIGIEVFNPNGGARNVIVANNSLDSCRLSVNGANHVTLQGNTVAHSPGYGIELAEGADFCAVGGNTVIAPALDGIVNLGCSGTVIDGNVIEMSNATYDGIKIYADSGVNLASNSGVVNGNVISGISGAGNGVRLWNNGGTSVHSWLVTNNNFSGISGPAVRMTNANFNAVAQNHFSGVTAASKVSSDGTSMGNVVRNNYGYSTETSGTATIPNSSTSTVVTHGLSVTPALKDIRLTSTGSNGNASKAWIATPSATTFAIHVDTDPGAATATFAWTATVL